MKQKKIIQNRIKFRAWDKTSKKMYYDVGLEPDEHGVEIILLPAYKNNGSRLIAHDFDCKLMQFTGLKDINEVDVFAGDIVKNKKSFVKIVGWNLKRSGWNVDCDSWKVIGNIHHNKDLLS